eukprot:3263338-Pyramimonas_sp.AAC.1
MDEATQFEVHLFAADSAEAGEASLDLAVFFSDVEVAKVEFSSTDETTLSVLIKAPDSGDTIASVSASSSASAGESLSAR